jgi:hypothetical protein
MLANTDVNECASIVWFIHETIITCNHCCSRKVTTITCSECVFVALGFQHAVNLRHIIICGLSGSTVFFHIIS